VDFAGKTEMLVAWSRSLPMGKHEGAETERKTAEKISGNALFLEVR
jgi:hypothetical protein